MADAASFDTHVGEQRFQLLINAVTDYAIYMLDADGRVATWNPGLRRFKGYEADEIIGRHFSTFLTEEDRAAGLPEHILRTAAEEGKFEGEGWRVRKDGTCFWAHILVDPIRDERGRLIGFAKITRDITDKKEAEQALHASEQRFRMLVQSVRDYAIYMLHPDGRVANWNAGAEAIKGYRADEIVGQHFSRFYTDEDRAGGEPARALETALRKGKYEKEAWRVRKDAMPQGGSIVLATAHVVDEAGEWVRISLADTGEGMADEVLGRAFEPFFTTKPVGKGTGLGLSQIHGFAAQSGGRAEIRSTLGKGTTVSIFLPRTERPLTPAQQESAVALPSEEMTVLLVEDNDHVREFAAELLEELGHRVLAAEDGEAALALLGKEKVDLLFSDVVMPGMSGVKLAHAARERAPSLLVVLASGYSDEISAGAGADFGFLRKPYDLQQLAEALRDARRQEMADTA